MTSEVSNNIKTSRQSALPSVKILGLSVNNLTMEDTLDKIEEFIRLGEPHHVITADSSMLVMAQDDASLREIIQNADLVTPDSSGVLWAARYLKRPLKAQISGVVIGEKLCERAAKSGFTLFFLGAAPEVAALAAEKMQAKYSGCKVVGTQDGFFKPEETETIIEKIAQCKPDVLLVAMGIPKQEKWIAEFRNSLEVSVLIGVGGTLDVLSGTTKRAPYLFQKLRLEWLWRVVSNPSKVSKVKLLPVFVRMVLKNGSELA